MSNNFRPKLGSAKSAPAAASSSKTSQRLPSGRSTPIAETIRGGSLDSSRPVLVSKFSTDNLSSKRTATKAWLHNLASAARPSGTSSSSISPTSTDKTIHISNPEFVYQGSPLANNQLGMGARRVGKPAEAFNIPVYQAQPASPPPRRSEDSERSVFSFASESSFGTPRRSRALPQLPLRIDSLPRRAASPAETIEQLATTPSPLPKSAEGIRERCESSASAPVVRNVAGWRSQPPSEALPLKSCLKKSTTSAEGTLEPASWPPKKTLMPFKAVLLGPVPRGASTTAEDGCLVSLHVSGAVYTTRLASLRTQPSRLLSYIESVIAEADTRPEDGSISQSKSPISVYSQVSEQNKGPQLRISTEGAQVLLHLPTSPITALRSSRASVFDDVPSDEGEADDSGIYETSSKLLEVPRRFNASRRVSGSSDGTSVNFLDTTPDEEVCDPFYLSRRDDLADLDSSQPPSLSTSPSSSTFAVDLAHLSAEKHLSAKRPLDMLLTPESAGSKSLDVLLDRSAKPYESILHFLREQQLPRRLQYSSSSTILSPKGEACGTPISMALQQLPDELRPALLPLLLHPIQAELEDLVEEAEYLGLDSLVVACQRELRMLKSFISSSSAVGRLNQQRHGFAANSPARKGPSVPSRLRPGHRQFHSEATISTHTVAGDAGWI